MGVAPIFPNRLHKGDKIGIFSPSEPLSGDRPQRMQPSLDLLRKNFDYEFTPHAFESLGYVASTTEEGIADINLLLAKDDVAALLASWGGKNCNRLIGKLPYSDFLVRRKPVIGFSDTGVMLNAISAVTGLITFYGPNIAGKLNESQHYDLRLLRGEYVPPFGEATDSHWTTITDGTATGRLFGGNLSTFVLGLAGSPQMAEIDESIFFWESASEPPQIIDQFLRCLANCGFLSRIKAMVVGDVEYSEVERKDRPINDLLREYGEEFDIPVVRIATFGHKSLENPAIPIGAVARLSTERQSVELVNFDM